MDIRRGLGAVLLLAGAYLLWQGLDTVMLIVDRGSPLSDALLQPPTSLWRIVAAAVLAAGGALALLKAPGGAIAAITGAVLFAGLPGVMAMMGTDQSMWIDEVYVALPVLAGAIGLAFLKRN